jgi:hypothetical protein
MLGGLLGASSSPDLGEGISSVGELAHPWSDGIVRLSCEDCAVSGLFVNAYPVSFQRDVALWRMARREGDDKRILEQELGMSLWADQDAFWSARKPEGRGEATLESFVASPPSGRTLFAARDALVAHAHEVGRAGEMSFMGLLEVQESDRFLLEPQLVVRLVQEPYIDDDAAVVVRAKTRWRSAQDLSVAEVARVAVGERAVRLAGQGPRRGYVESLGQGGLHLRVGTATEVVAAEDYALVTGSRLVVAWRGQRALRDLQVASGVLTVSNRRNRYAVKHRFQTAGRMLRALGWPVPLPGGGCMELGKSPLSVQIESQE